MEIKKSVLTELLSSYSDLRDAVQSALRSSFELEENTYLYLVDMFLSHPKYGTCVIVEHYPSNNLYHVPFAEVAEGSVVLGTTDMWQQVVKSYSVVKEVPDYGASEESFSESVSFEIDESSTSTALVLKMRIIKKGFGNLRDNNYYSESLLSSKKTTDMFKGIKMYVTEHKRNEVNVRNEVAEILEAYYDESEQGVVARVGVFNSSFAESVRAREELGILSGLHCSITASGSIETEPFSFGGRTGKKVAEFDRINTVDFVARGGAGGQALSIE